MPPFERMDRKQWAVLWSKTGVSSFGEAVIAEPVEIKVRWINKPRQVAGPQNTPITVDATVVVNTIVPIGSLMWLGRLEDFYGVGSAGDDTQIMEVVAAPRTPDIKARNLRRTLGLKYYKSSLPGRA